MWFDKVLLDIELQRDFFSPGGTCFRRPNLKAARNVRRLFAWARRRGIPAISTMLRIRPGEIGPLAPAPHCVDGSNGEKRISGALLARHVDFGIRNVTDLPPDVFDRYQQVIFEKRHTDILQHARAERLLTRMPSVTFVVLGAGTAGGIAEAVVGLIARDFKVQLATDAILDLDSLDAEFAWQRMFAKGAAAMTTDEIIGAARRAAHRTVGSRRRLAAPFSCGPRALTG